jgi:hypothetical protein
MHRALIDNTTDYDPDTVKLLGWAFDACWQDIAGNYSEGRVSEDRHNRLTRIILDLAKSGERDVIQIKDKALRLMLRAERPLAFTRL